MAGGVDEDPHTFPGVTSVRALGKDFTPGSLPGTAADARGNFVAAVDGRVVDQVARPLGSVGRSRLVITWGNFRLQVPGPVTDNCRSHPGRLP
jgi:hypothetical protein